MRGSALRLRNHRQNADLVLNCRHDCRVAQPTPQARTTRSPQTVVLGVCGSSSSWGCLRLSHAVLNQHWPGAISAGRGGENSLVKPFRPATGSITTQIRSLMNGQETPRRHQQASRTVPQYRRRYSHSGGEGWLGCHPHRHLPGCHPSIAGLLVASVSVSPRRPH